MDKVFSTRLDENLIKKVDHFIKARSITKKSLVEQSLRTYLKGAESNIDLGIIDQSFGAWKRDEAIHKTWSRGRSAFNRGLERYSRDKDS
jgi:predicted transcriptional regulator